ncbi:MAG: SUMF1/EgtB/PvdO family nonheme iron enzyme [Parachlamydiaceae bacterium]|nr:SUMF1/EgtB/PvdO family nonheme iron enzyme [Parachlamydiaceae bacterium]
MDQRILGDYKVIKPIGQGTLGTVFLAEHRFMKRQYVLKVLPEELATDRGFIQRFEEEISVLSTLDHPNIVKIHNISFASGQYFVVTDCIVDELGETTNLAQYALGLGRRWEEEELYLLLKQIADPLDYAHGKKIGNKGLVHRSLKLNNILVGKHKNRIEIYLSDFGLSRIIGPGAVLTKTFKNVADALGIGAVVASQRSGQDLYPNPPVDTQKLLPLHTSFLQNYAFLAPEQKRLDSPLPVDFKADIYAFGVLVYFLLMNELPEGVFDMPSSRREYRYNWDQLIYSCLQNQPGKRPEHLVEALESIRRSEKSSLKSSHAPSIAIHQPIENENTVSQIATKYKIPDQKHEELVEAKASSKAINLVEIIAGANSTVTKAEKESNSINEEKSTTSSLKPVFHVSKLERPRTDLDPAAVFQIDPTVKTYSPEHKDVTNIKPLLTDMAVIRGGSFYRGSHDGNRDEMPRHQITIPSVAIDIHPVTNEQFVRFLEVMGGEKDNNHNDIIRLRDSRIKRSGGKLSIESGYAKHPVVGVTWYGSVAYAKWIGKRLPTEGEWEIAARGGVDPILYPTGDDIEKTQANFFSSDTTAVMSYAPNGYGLYDMAGNVYEWCSDWYGYNYYEISIQEPDCPQGPLQGVYRVLRGGCWKSLKEDLRCSRRHRNNPGTVNGTYGFRCAADVE